MGVWFIERFQRFLRLPFSRKMMLLEALGFHWAARAGLSLVPFRKLGAFVNGLGGSRQAGAGGVSADYAAWAVSASSALTPRATCLTRALALQAMLRRRGYPAALRIGVAKPRDQALEAHAWVELDGQAYLGGPELDRFAPMPPAGAGV